MAEIQLLKFDQGNESFQWHGTPEQLQSFVNFVLDLSEEQHGELSQDKAHNAVTYKIKDSIYIRLYTTTRKLVINGPENRSFKAKLLDRMQEHERELQLHDQHHSVESLNQEEQAVNLENRDCVVLDKADDGVPDKPESENGTGLKSEIDQLRRDLEKLQDFVYNGGLNMQNISSSPSCPEEDKDMQIKSLHDENCALKAKVENLSLNLDQEVQNLREASSKIRELEEERSSLLTALRLLQLDTAKNSTTIAFESQQQQQPKSSNGRNNGTSPNPPWRTVAKQTKQSKTKTKQSKPRENDQATRTNTPSTIIMGDSIVKRLRNDKLSETTRTKVRVCSFPGAHVEDMYHYAAPTLKKVEKPTHVILHIGTNDLHNKTPKVVADTIVDLAHHVEGEYPQTKIAISELTTRADDEDFTKGIKEVNKHISRYCNQSGWSLIKHKNIDGTCLNNGKLHLNSKGVAVLASNFTQAISNFH